MGFGVRRYRQVVSRAASVIVPDMRDGNSNWLAKIVEVTIPIATYEEFDTSFRHQLFVASCFQLVVNSSLQALSFLAICNVDF